MPRDIVNMINFFSGSQISIKTFLVDFLFHLLDISLFGSNFHISQPFRFLFLQLFSVLIDLNGLLIEHVLLLLFHQVPSVLLLLLLPPPDI